MKAKKIWVVVADSSKARILENTGPNRSLVEVSGASFAAPRSHGRDLYSDRSGRAFDSRGAGRHAMVHPTSPEEQGRISFIKTLATWIERPRHARAFDSLILVAPPKALGLLRKELSQQTRARIVCECDKDLTNASNEKIAITLEDRVFL